MSKGLSFNDLRISKLAEKQEWGTREVELRNNDGEVVYYQNEVEFPKDWSDRAVKIVASKYFYGADEERETSLKQLVGRVVGQIVDWGEKENYFESSTHAVNFAAELEAILVTQHAAFNSPVWFNLGVEGRRQQASACYINSLEDSMKDILELVKTEGMIFKYGSGAGVNLSKLRHKGAELSGGGESSGPLSFMKTFDVSAGQIKSGGTTRRAACMRILNASHPDVEDFVVCKSEEEKKARILIEAGYDPGIDGEAYGTVAFQNANHSVMFTDEDMESREDLLGLMAQEAWKSGDPGVMFYDTLNTFNTCPNSGVIRATNPCGEYTWLDDTSCNLASINLLKFIKNGKFDYNKFIHVVEIMITAMDIISGQADYPIKKIEEETLKYRTLGLGFSNLGALLMVLGLPYDSIIGRDLTSCISSLMTGAAYKQSATIANVLKEPFPEYEKNQIAMNDVLRKQALESQKLIDKSDFRGNEFASIITKQWDDAISIASIYGFRNAQVTCIAPTGTISFLMDCDTTGIEPAIALRSYKSLVGGGTLPMALECVKEAVPNVFGDTEKAKKILEHILEEGTLEGILDPDINIAEYEMSVFDCALPVQERMISWRGHLDMVAAVQPFISMGISKTINMPNDVEPEDIKEAYITAWKKGLKNVSIYRDGSKGSQPLNVVKKENEKTINTSIGIKRRKLPLTRSAITHKFDISGHKGYITVGLHEDGSPGEVFINMAKEGSTVSGLIDSFAISVSLLLQYGVELEDLISRFKGSRYEPSGFTGNESVPIATSITDYLFKWLESEFIVGRNDSVESIQSEDIEVSAKICPKCGSLMVQTGDCHTCTNCGETGGCG